MEIIHECKNCGNPFEPTCHATRQKYCSDTCRIKYNNAKRYAPPGNACVQCGATVDQSGKRGRNRRFCGDAYRKIYYINKAAEKKREERLKPRVCPNCGRDFVPVCETGPARNPGAWRRQLAEAAQKSDFESANSKRILPRVRHHEACEHRYFGKFHPVSSQK